MKSHWLGVCFVGAQGKRVAVMRCLVWNVCVLPRHLSADLYACFRAIRNENEGKKYNLDQ